MGIGYFALGMLIAEKKMRYNKNALFAVAFECIVSSYIVPYSIIVYALRYITVFCLFLPIIQINLPASSVYVKLRHSSKVVYFTHMLFFFTWSAIKSFQNVNGMDAFVIVTSMTVITSLLIIAHKDDKSYNRIYNGSKISRIPWLFEPKCRNNAELTYTQRLQIASYFP